MAKVSTGVQVPSLGPPPNLMLPWALSWGLPLGAALSGRKIHCFWRVLKGSETPGSAPRALLSAWYPFAQNGDGATVLTSPGCGELWSQAALETGAQWAESRGARQPGRWGHGGASSGDRACQGSEAEVPFSPHRAWHCPVGCRVRVWGPHAWPLWG